MENAIKAFDEKNIYGSFYLLECEFALSVSYVQEVVNAPNTYTAVPLAPTFVRGLFNLRGTVIPVLDLRRLLNLNQDEQGPSKIAVIEFEGACIGLLFDKTGEVFKDNADERSDLNSGEAERLISGVFKKDGGARLIQILDVSKLFKLQRIPKDSNHNRLRQTSLARRRGQKSQCISFLVGPAQCSLPISGIQEIIKADRINDSVLAGDGCIGTIDLRGSTVPVIDFASLLKYREVRQSQSFGESDRRIIVMRLDQELFGLMVDEIVSIISYYPDELLSFPVVEQNRGDMFIGCITGHADREILLLDHTKILTNKEVNQITHGHSKLYRKKSDDVDVIAAKKAGRSTYITFKVQGLQAVPIKEVREIIELPKNLMQPPGRKPHVLGVLNLRGDLVTIVDARSLYLSDKEAAQSEARKVLVFKNGDQHFGLVVDAVESIITFSESDKLTLPRIIYDQGADSLSSDVSEAVQFTDTQGNKIGIMILSVERVAQRALGSMAA